MTEEAIETVDSTIPGRLNTAEQKLHTLWHRVGELEQKDLPHRVTNLESTTSRMAEDLHEVKGAVSSMSEKQDIQFQALGEAVSGIKNKWAGGVLVLGALIAVLTVVIAAVGLLPKFDLITVKTDTPPAEVDE